MQCPKRHEAATSSIERDPSGIKACAKGKRVSLRLHVAAQIRIVGDQKLLERINLGR